MMWFMHGPMGRMMSGWGPLGLLAGLIGFVFVVGTLVALVVLAIWLWRRSEAVGRGEPRGYPSASDILSARYARGEISRQEYLEARDELRCHTHS
jgi:putative membrane protein